MYHMRDGPEQEARDARFKETNPISVQKGAQSFFEYDTVLEAKKWLEARRQQQTQT